MLLVHHQFNLLLLLHLPYLFHPIKVWDFEPLFHDSATDYILYGGFCASVLEETSYILQEKENHKTNDVPFFSYASWICSWFSNVSKRCSKSICFYPWEKHFPESSWYFFIHSLIICIFPYSDGNFHWYHQLKSFKFFMIYLIQFLVPHFSLW